MGENCQRQEKMTMLRMLGKISVLVLSLALVSGVMSQASSEDGNLPLDQTHFDGYLQLLHSVEQEVALRQETGHAEDWRLYPFGGKAQADTAGSPYRHLTIAKALQVLETQFPDPARAEHLTALVALANARNFVNLTEYDSALVWFDAAAVLDSTGDLSGEIEAATLATAAALGDSARMAGELDTLLEKGPTDDSRDMWILALRWTLASGSRTHLGALADSLMSRSDSLDGGTRFWLARSLQRLERRDDLYGQLRQLILNGGLSLGLTTNQRGWMLTTLPDVSFMLGLDEQARSLYSVLLDSPLENLNLWATYQLAGLDFAAGQYQAAATGFAMVCRSSLVGTWHDQACALAKTTEDLERIRREGEPYGTGRFYTP